MPDQFSDAVKKAVAEVQSSFRADADRAVEAAGVAGTKAEQAVAEAARVAKVNEDLKTRMTSVENLTQRIQNNTRAAIRETGERAWKGRSVVDGPGLLRLPDGLGADKLGTPAHREMNEVLSVFDPDDGVYAEMRREHDIAYFFEWASRRYSDVDKFQNIARRYRAKFMETAKRAGMRGLDTIADVSVIFTGFSGDLVGRFVLEQKLSDVIPTFEHPDGVGDFQWPVVSSGVTVYRATEFTGDVTSTSVPLTASQPAFYRPTFHPEVAAARVNWSREFAEDSAPTVYDAVASEIVLGLRLAEEDALLNGSTLAVHLDNDVCATTAVAPATMWDGVRQKAFDETTNRTVDASTWDESAIIAGFKKSKKWLIRRADAVICLSPVAFWGALGFNKLKGIQDYGAQATMVTGELGSIFGRPIVISDLWKDMSNTGRVEAAGNTTTGGVIFNRNVFKLGRKRQISLERDYFPRFQAFEAVGTLREDFQSMYLSTTAGNHISIVLKGIPLT